MAAFPDPAVGDGVFRPSRHRVAVELLELVIRLEGAVIVGCLAPRDIDCGRNVTPALCLLLREVGWGEQAAGELVGLAHVDQALGADRSHGLVAESTNVEVRLRGRVRRGLAVTVR